MWAGAAFEGSVGVGARRAVAGRRAPLHMPGGGQTAKPQVRVGRSPMVEMPIRRIGLGGRDSGRRRQIRASGKASELFRAMSGTSGCCHMRPLRRHLVDSPRHTQGKRYAVLLNATTRRNNDGQVTGVVGVGQDISELKEVVAESERVAEGLVRLIETANAPIFGIDTQGKVTEWNATAARLLGFGQDWEPSGGGVSWRWIGRRHVQIAPGGGSMPE